MGDKLLDAMTKGLSLQTAEDAITVHGWLSTGNYALNWAVSDRFAARGWPLGCVVELFGDESTGKTFLLLRAVTEAQRSGGLAVFDDVEGRLSKDWARRRLGVDTGSLLYTCSETVEEHYELLDGVLEQYEKHGEDRPLLALLDSIGQLSTVHEMETPFKTRDMTKAYQLRKLFRMMKSRLQGLPVVYIATNHVYAKIGASPWESKKESTGGGGFKYQSSLRLSMRTPKKVKGDGDLAGIIIRMVVEKNSVAIPYRETSMMIPFDRPINPHSGLIAKLLDLGYLGTTSKHTLTWEGEDTGIPAHKTQSNEAFLKQDESAIALLTAYPDLLTKVDADLERRETGKAPEEAE